uniref:Uncharacterized protein n=1 Tax=Anguilla anguilla TaxID=7936 RepID=A0A0E9XV59_ANGAN
MLIIGIGLIPVSNRHNIGDKRRTTF